jgi:hypothetical protein
MAVARMCRLQCAAEEPGVNSIEILTWGAQQA